MLARNTELLTRLQNVVHEGEQRLPGILESHLQAQMLAFQERMQAQILDALKTIQAEILNETAAEAKIRGEIAVRIAESEKRMAKSLLETLREEREQLREFLGQLQSKQPPGS